MTIAVRERFPNMRETSLDELVRLLGEGTGDDPLEVGDVRVVDFLVGFARRLLAPAMARRYPELASLGFFLRRGEIQRALDRLGGESGVFRFPRGLVFHVPPANVDTIFVYSWALSALAGNRNVVRVSERSAGAAEVVLDALREAALEADPVVARTQRMITYGREDAVTDALSSACDLRVIWGGDASVSSLRRHPLPPHARDLTFPDRSSFAVVSVDGWARAQADERKAAAEGFVNDAYWFDQAACASPRAVYWVGPPARADEVKHEFLALVEEVVRERHLEVDSSMAVEKLVAGYGLAVDGVASSLEFPSNSVAVATLRAPSLLPRRWLGAGTFPECHVESLENLVHVVTRKDQTVSAFGFAPDELARFVIRAGHRGVDRVVAFGEALSFAAIWDGYDLLREFSRLVTLSGGVL
jgi:hypothetical protein